VEFLATDLSNYITGQVICVCGGMVLSPPPFRLAARAEGFRTRGNIDPLAAIERVAHRKLYHLHRARTLRDLQAPPGNRLEALAGDRRGQHSIRINDQWRVCFRGIVNGKRSITGDTALRLGKFFGTSAETWLDLQSDYDLRVIRRTAGRDPGPGASAGCVDRVEDGHHP